jgi:hypothetical protein
MTGLNPKHMLCKHITLNVEAGRKSGITSAVILNTTAAEFCHLPAAPSNSTQTLITSATALASCQRKSGATLVHSCHPMTSYQTNQAVNQNLLTRAVDAHQ